MDNEDGLLTLDLLFVQIIQHAAILPSCHATMLCPIPA